MQLQPTQNASRIKIEHQEAEFIIPNTNSAS